MNLRRNWLSDEQWAVIEPCLPKNETGARPVDDRRVLSGIIHVVKSGCRWRDCPSVYSPYTTAYNRWNRCSRRKVWRNLFEALRSVSPGDDFHAIDSPTGKAYRAAAGAKGGGEAGDRAVPWGARKSTRSATASDVPSRST